MEFTNEKQEDNKLDNDFRRILCIIKQYIPYINSNHQLSLYRSWLEKLSTADREKAQRNMYLFELARQVKSNRLLPPFNHHPPLGPLRSLPKINLFRPIPNLETLDSPQNNQGCLNSLDPDSIITSNDMSQAQQRILQLQPRMQDPFEFQDDRNMQTIFMQPTDNLYYHPCYVEEESDTPLEIQTKSSTKIKKRKPKNVKSPHKLSPESSSKGLTEKSERPVRKTSMKAVCTSDEPETFDQKDSVAEDEVTAKDDSSWCDLTDSSQTSVIIMGSGDNQKSPTKTREKNNKKTLENGQITNENEESRQSCYSKNKFNSFDELEQIDRKNNNPEFNEVKLGLKDTNFISSDWKKTIEGLQMRLTETLNQNNELKSIINTLQIKVKEETFKNKERGESKKKCELHKREIEALQQIQVDNMKKLEKSFHVKLSEAERSYQQKIDKLKANYEIKIRELHVKHDHVKREKDQEMCRLSEIIQQQCIRMSNEIAALRNQIENIFSNHNNDGDKIIILQKCVSKMDKLYVRSEKEYQKQIDKLKQELDLKDKVMQIQLKTQRAELIARTSVEKQKQFDEVINNLEIKYIKMLEFHETQVMETKEHDEEKIQHLKHLLEENKISYNNVL